MGGFRDILRFLLHWWDSPRTIDGTPTLFVGLVYTPGAKQVTTYTPGVALGTAYTPGLVEGTVNQ